MYNTRIHTYKEVNLLTITLLGDGSCRRRDPIVYHKRDVINKMACYFPYDGWDLVSELYVETGEPVIPPGGKIFVASECKTVRDTFRNSGYKIVLDPAKADAVIVPDVKAEMFHNLKCNIVARDTNKDELYLVSVDKAGYLAPKLTLDEMDRAKKYLETAMCLEVDDATESVVKVWFIPKCKELEEVMVGNKRTIPYVQESLVPITPSTTISPETLLFWENMTDMNLLTRTMCTSDWAQYPITILAFMCVMQEKGKMFYGYMTNDFRRLLNNIGWQSYYGFSNYLDRNITPKDYAMLQSYMFMKLGIGEDGGIVDAKKLPVVQREILNLLQRKMMFKKFEIPATMKLGNIRSTLSE